MQLLNQFVIGPDLHLLQHWEFPEGASKDKLIEIVRNERRSELALEGHRHKDIIRWRIADNVLNGWCHGLKTNDVVGTDDGYVRVEKQNL